MGWHDWTCMRSRVADGRWMTYSCRRVGLSANVSGPRSDRPFASSVLGKDALVALSYNRQLPLCLCPQYVRTCSTPSCDHTIHGRPPELELHAGPGGTLFQTDPEKKVDALGQGHAEWSMVSSFTTKTAHSAAVSTLPSGPHALRLDYPGLL